MLPIHIVGGNESSRNRMRERVYVITYSLGNYGCGTEAMSNRTQRPEEGRIEIGVIIVSLSPLFELSLR